jgi:hypothetical protein
MEYKTNKVYEYLNLSAELTASGDVRVERGESAAGREVASPRVGRVFLGVGSYRDRVPVVVGSEPLK